MENEIVDILKSAFEKAVDNGITLKSVYFHHVENVDGGVTLFKVEIGLEKNINQ